MAKDKKGFILYADLIKVVSKLPDETAGKLFKIILSYVNDLDICIDDLLLEIAFEPIKNQLKRDLIKFEEVKSKRSDAGKRSAELRALKKEEQKPTNPTSVESVQQSSTNPTVTDTVNDTVTVNDIVTTTTEENLVEDIFIKASKNYKTYAEQLYKDAGFIEALSRNQIKDVNIDVCKNTIHKYLKEFLSHLNEYKHVHHNKKSFSANFSNWLRKKTIVKVYPKKQEITRFS
tara:strand:+ start:2392 stop:3087 length:696 start_codon:yes stop_codon:yes gene_type:complete